MPTLERHTPGSFNWFELATPDQTAAKQFYSALFGWQAVDSPVGPSEIYTIFKLEGLDVAGAYAITPEMRAEGVSPHWDIYIAVTNADETAAKIEAAGGKLLSSPFDVMTFGRMAVAVDPTGAVFCIWQAFDHIGVRVTGIEGTVCWADLTTPDPEASAQFYRQVFGWELWQSDKDPSAYRHIRNAGIDIGGIPPAATNTRPGWMVTFLSSDAQILTNRAGALGANTLFAVTEIAGGQSSILADPQGAPFGLYQPAAH